MALDWLLINRSSDLIDRIIAAAGNIRWQSNSPPNSSWHSNIQANAIMHYLNDTCPHSW